MNGQLNKSIVNPWLASAVSAAPILFFLHRRFSDHAPSFTDIERPGLDALVGRYWWIGRCRPGLCGAYSCHEKWEQVRFVGLTVTAALIMSLVIDHFGWFRMAYHPLNIWRIVGGLLLVGGVTLIAKF